MNSRLQRYYDKKSQRQVVLFVIGSVIFLILIVVYGFPLLLGLTSTIGSLRHSSSAPNAVSLVTPSVPNLDQNFTATSSANIKITGVADAKTFVEVFQNSQSQGTVTSQDDGTFSMDVALQSGSNIFTATAINATGQRSGSSETYIVNYILKKPGLDITSPKDGDTVNSTPINITGQTDPGDTITINNRLAIVDKDGKFSYSMGLSDGDNKLHFVATDVAGNQTVKDLTVKYQK